MAQKKAHEVDAFLARPARIYPIVLIYGPDKGLVSERAHSYAKVLNIPLDDPFSTIRLEAAEIESDPARLIDEAQTASLFGGDRLIWVRNAASGKGLADAIKQLSATTLEHTFIIIEAGDLKKGAGLRGTVEAAEKAIALPCYADDERSLDALIDKILSELHLAITLDARKLLRESLGGDRLASRMEIEKLCLYAKGKEQISVDDVIQAVSDVSTSTQDELIDAVITGNMSVFSSAFNRLLATGQPLFLMLAAGARTFQQLELLRETVEHGNKSVAAAVAGAKPPIFFRRQKAVEKAVDIWPLEAIQAAEARLQATVLKSRQNQHLDVAIIRQNLMALTVEAAKLARSKHH